jgi:Na+/proline symporter
MLIAGVNLYAVSLVMQALLGWPLWTSIVLGAAIVLAYITVGGLSSAASTGCSTRCATPAEDDPGPPGAH